MKYKLKNLECKSLQYRRDVLKAIHRCGAGHTGGSLSCVDILNVLYNCVLNISPDDPLDPNRDRYIQSKGHSVEALYVVLSDRGFFPAQHLSTMHSAGSAFIGHPTRDVPGIEQNTGALGHGLSLAVGCALAGRMDRRDYRVFCLLGDGELGEGSSWEAMMAASHYGLDNLTAIIDRNRLQITAGTEDVMNLEPLKERLQSFGFAVSELDGHDLSTLSESLSSAPRLPGRPTAILAHTIKGKGVSFIENDKSWHHRVPNEEELRLALEELNSAVEEISL